MNRDEYTITETMIDVGDGHTLYAQDWGNPNAKTPIIFLHGGPGSGNNDGYKAFFDPKVNHVVFFDQRGSGRSLPYGELRHNTTQKMVEDISVVADHFKLKTFVIVGGSWGSTLALAYGVKYPKRVSAMVLRGIITGLQSEIDFVDKGGFRDVFPEVWENFQKSAPAKYQDDPSVYHTPRILGEDPDAAKQSAYAYDALEGGIMQLDDRQHQDPYDEFDPIPTRTEVAYMSQGCFLPKNYIYDNVKKLTMPILLVQGRYDMVCPPYIAHKLHKQLPNSELIWTLSGHRQEHETWAVIRARVLQFK